MSPFPHDWKTAFPHVIKTTHAAHEAMEFDTYDVKTVKQTKKNIWVEIPTLEVLEELIEVSGYRGFSSDWDQTFPNAALACQALNRILKRAKDRI